MRYPIFFWIFFSLPVGAVSDLRWAMVDIQESSQGDSHVIQFECGEVIVIDCGPQGKSLLEYLRRHQIKSIKTVIISHFHKDHYGGLETLLLAGIHIGEVVVNVPKPSQCDAEKPWGCDSFDIQRVLKLLNDRRIPIRHARAGDVYYRAGDVSLEALYVYDGENSPVGRTDINDTSILLRLSRGKTVALFTGDLNRQLGKYLAVNGQRLKADILKVPHHGTEGIAPPEFFDRVGATVALVPAPKSLWLSERSRTVKQYFESKQTATYVSGLDGEVTVVFKPAGFSVLTEHFYGPYSNPLN
jgi:competence protein ComEC